jgi:hypothetical protein
LRIEFAGDPMMQVSHETIYQALFVQGRGELRRELARCLRTGRAKRRSRHRPENTGRIKDMVMISECPAEAADRAVPGHWEGDLIIGKDCKSAVGTLAGRSTRYVLLLHLPGGRGASSVDAAMRQAIATLPGELFRTLTWDQGKEIAYHAQFTIDTGIQACFCDPHKPWQRGPDENINGLLRGAPRTFRTADPYRIFTRKDGITWQGNTGSSLLSSVRKQPGWSWRRPGRSRMLPASSGLMRRLLVTGCGPTVRSTTVTSRCCGYPSGRASGSWNARTASCG